MQDTQEIWKDIAGYNGLYQASSLGNIKRCDSVVKHSLGGMARKKGRLMKQALNPRTGYLNTCFSINGKKFSKTTHTIIAKTFVPNPLGLPEANHKDGNKLNNKANNFEWVTKSGNRIHAINNDLIKTIPSEKLLTQNKLNTLLNLSMIGYTQGDLSRIFKLSQSTVSRALNGKRRYAFVLKGE